MKGSRSNYYSGFDPKSIPGCTIWLDAADARTITVSGTNVTQWNDKSGLGFHFSTTTAIRPTYANQTVTFPSGAVMSTGNFITLTGTYAFVVARLGVFDGTTDMMLAFTFAFAGDYSIRYSGGVLIGTPALSGSANDFGNQNYFVNGSFNPNFRPSVYSNRHIIAAQTTQTGAFTPVTLSSTFSSRFFIGDIYEVILYSSPVSAVQRQQVEGYLARKWGIGYNLSPSISSPLSLSNCVLWLDGTSGMTGDVWVDKSPSSNNATRTAGTITARTVGGRQALSFSNVQMTYSNNLIFNGTTGSSCFFAFFVPNVRNGHLLMATNLAGLVNHFLWDDQNLYENIGFTTRQLVSGFFHNTLQVYTNIANRDSNTWIFRDGIQIFSNTYASGYTGLTYTVGLPGTTWTGTICDVIVYSRTLTVAEQQQVENYLSQKWKIVVRGMSEPHPYRTIPPTVRQFVPTDISGCALWLDAADRSTLVLSGSNVALWGDKSGNGRNAIGNTGTGTYSSNGLNSRPTVQITPTGNMRSPIPAGTFPSGFAIFVVYQKTGANGSFDTIVSRTAVNIPSPFDFYESDGPIVSRLIGDGTNYRQMASALSVSRRTTPTILSANVVSSTPSNWIECLNGELSTYALTSVSGTGAYGDTGTSLHLGTRGNGGTTMTGNISEVIAYSTSSVFTTAQRQQIEGYLARKWGLDSNFLSPITTPLSISGCALWLDAADAGTLTVSGSNVTTWADKSGNGRNFTGTNTPTYDASLGEVVFNGTNTILSNTTNLPTTTQAYPFFVVFRPLATTRGRFSELRINGQVIVMSIDTTVIVGHTLSRFTEQTSLSVTSNVRRMYASAASSSTDIQFSIDGSASSTWTTDVSSSTPQTLTNFVIGSDGRGAVFYNGGISEMILYNQFITRAQRQQVENYLSQKWGISNVLPLNPYRFGMPALTAGFTPLEIPNCALWLDAADLTTLTLSGNTVTMWADKSGNRRSASNVGAGVVSGGTLNGLNTLNFATGSYLLTPSFTMNTITRTAFAVYRFTSNTFPTDQNYYGLLFLLGNAVTTNSFQFAISRFRGIDTPSYGWTGEFGLTNVGYFPRGGYSFEGAAGPTNQPLMLTVQRSTSNTGLVRFTGVPAGTISFNGTNAFLATEALRVGSGLSNTQLAELLYYNSALTNTEIQEVEGYLAWKWGLVNSLPVVPISSGITPLSISNCILWLDGTSGMSGDVWVDKSPTSNNATRTAGTITTTTVNGIQALSFSNVEMTYSNNLIFSGTTGSSCFIVFSAPNLGNGHLLNTVQGGLNNHLLWTDATLFENIGVSARRTVAGFSHNQFQVYTNIANRNGYTSMFRNGTATHSTTYGSGYTSLTYAVTTWTGTACDVIVYSRTLSFAEQRQIEDYLARKWGITSMIPGSHPYKESRP